MNSPHIIKVAPETLHGETIDWDKTIIHCPGPNYGNSLYELPEALTPEENRALKELEGNHDSGPYTIGDRTFAIIDGDWVVDTHRCGPCDWVNEWGYGLDDIPDEQGLYACDFDWRGDWCGDWIAVDIEKITPHQAHQITRKAGQ